MLELSHISKTFKTKDAAPLQVLADVNLKLKRGSMLCLSGPSGCGKTTILEIAAGTLKADSGVRKVDSKRIGYAFQDDCLIPWMTVQDNLIYASSGYYLPSEAQHRAANWLDVFGLKEARNKMPLELSGGMRRRLNIARSFLVEPEFLLLDEPFAFQDAEMSNRIADEMLRLLKYKSVTILLSSHENVRSFLPDCPILGLTQAPVRLLS